VASAVGDRRWGNVITDCLVKDVERRNFKLNLEKIIVKDVER
jgi:hypothetical protein